MNGYGKDLAFIHNAGFSTFVREASSGILRALRQRNIRRGLIVDLGCGSGLLARALTRAGYDVLGVDLSTAMLELARQQAPKARFVQGSLFGMVLPRCVAVTATGECLNYLFDPTNCIRALRRLFARVHKALTPGGVFIFDMATPGRMPQPLDRFFRGRNWTIQVHVEEDREHSVLTRSMTIRRKMGKVWRVSREVHRQKLYSPAEITKELRHAGFRVLVRKGYGRKALGPGWRVFVARLGRH